MSFKAALQRYKQTCESAIQFEQSYLGRTKGRIYQDRRAYFIKKKVGLEIKLKFWNRGTIYKYMGRKTWSISDEIIIDNFTLTTIDDNIDEVTAFIEWQTDCKVLIIEREEIEIGIIGS